ncbi:fasciclin-3 isoform X3 [Aricia agestis]|uniref:fasciclin-3 isoform X3 n=1 Tax=Aricia agestis TaxID=91739 RepID=UPI001C203AF0|nr:fasciclin-3 isoform X3 [Aricia agestis]
MAVFPALFGFFLLAVVKGQVVDITPREAVRRVGDELIVQCKVPYPIDSCRMTVGPNSYRLLPTNQDEEVVYSGNGLQFGECGGLIKHVREEWNGNISCVVPPQSGSIELTATMQLTVARPPLQPLLITDTHQSSFKEGDYFMAQCVVPSGRPAAKVTWYLDDEPLLEGIHQAVIRPEPGSDLKTISQNLSRTLSADDNGKRLICRAEHEALDGPKDVARQLVVEYPPKRMEAGQITIFGLKIGEEGRLNVTVRANPAPTASWTVGDLVVSPRPAADDAAVVALEPEHLGGGYYNVTLILQRVAKEDVDRTYYLRVSNELGQEEFAVRLSTMDEPAGVELGSGAIAGIVVAVLILLIAVSLIVFAKATDRWCFGGSRSRDHTKNSGESTPAGDVLIERGIPRPSRTSDTESAAGQRSRLAALGARMRAVLPRSKDKVQDTAPETRDEEQGDEKKSVVYAELALSETVEKPPPPATEYAEIVYTQQQPAAETKE